MTIARGQMNRQLYQDGSRGIKDLMEGKISDDEIRNIISVLEDVDIVDDEMSDEDNEVMERLQRLYDQNPNYQYNENNMYEGPRDMRAGGGITSADAKAMLESYAPQGERLAFVNPQEEMMLKAMGGAGLPAVAGIPSYFSISKAFKSITKPFKKAADVVGDVLDKENIDKIAQVASFIPGPHQPFAQAYTAGSSSGMFGDGYGGFQIGGFTPSGGTFGTTSTSGPSFGSFSFAPQQGGFPTGGGSSDGGIFDILRTGTDLYNTYRTIEEGGDYEDEEAERDKSGDVIVSILKNNPQLVGNLLDKLGITKKEAVGAAGGATFAKLAYEDQKRLIEQLKKDLEDYRARVAIKKGEYARAERPEIIGRPGTAEDVVRRPAMMGGIMDLDVRTNPEGVQEIDYREKGGFVPPIGIKEKADDIPAMLSNNEFVFTADAVRAAGGGSVNKGAQKMYALMKQLEGQA